MNRLESIKERLTNLEAGKIVKYDYAMNLATQYMVDYKNDVEYLLSKIEHAEMDLFTIALTSKNPSQHFCEDAKIYKRIALKSLIGIGGKHSELAKETLEELRLGDK